MLPGALEGLTLLPADVPERMSWPPGFVEGVTLLGDFVEGVTLLLADFLEGVASLPGDLVEGVTSLPCFVEGVTLLPGHLRILWKGRLCQLKPAGEALTETQNPKPCPEP